MSSNSIYQNDTKPYFYIIRHIASGKLYAGSRWATGCHPREFMNYYGYTTSSTTINSLISFEGLSSFEILRIDTNLDGLTAQEYETLFLQTLDCGGSNQWFNLHNNNGISFGTEKFTQSMLLKYGVKHSQQIPDIRKKGKQTKKEKYNNENYNNRDQAKQSSIEMYGVDNPSKSDIVKDKIKQTNLTRYGVDNPFKSNIVKDKIKQTNLNLYGVDCGLKDPDIRNKGKQTKKEKYNNENYNNIEQIKQTNAKIYGFENVFQNELIKEKSKQTMLSKFGVTHNSKIQVQCPWCGKVGGNTGMRTNHFDNCKLFPSRKL